MRDTRAFGPVALFSLIAVCGAAFSLAGCRGPGKAQSLPRMSEVAAAQAASDASRRVLLDGSFEEWPADRSILADADWVYFRVRIDASSPMPLAANTETLALWLDADGNASTGAKMPQPPEAAKLGVDVVLEFSPQNPAGGVDRGSKVYAYDAAGQTKTELNHATLGAAAAPTVAASEFEVRIDRHSEQGKRFAQGLGGRGGPISAMFVLVDASGKLVGWSDPERASLPAASAEAPKAEALVPPKQPGTVRVVSYNVLKGSLMTNPQPFARVLQVLDPDVILFQEWETDPSSAVAWFSATVTGKPAWHARTGPNGVVVVSPWPIEPLGPSTFVMDPAKMQSGRPDIRFVGGVVKTPAGDLITGSLHLKCCGSANTSEELRRQGEAASLQQTLAPLMASNAAPFRVIGGDFNLVGTAAPLNLFRAGLDADATELAIAQPRILGDGAFYTWSDDASEFPPGRLDYLVYGDAKAQVVNAFVLDTSRLSDRALVTMGLDRRDTAASDHMPLVLDLRAK